MQSLRPLDHATNNTQQGRHTAVMRAVAAITVAICFMQWKSAVNYFLLF